jgi:hypothetical protein
LRSGSGRIQEVSMKAFAMNTLNAPIRPRTLGWFSIGLGLAELLAPRSLSRFVGVRDHGPLVRMLGLREITSGVGILTRPRPRGWLWSRVAGDAMDLALLGAAFRSYRGRPVRLAAAAAVAGVALLDVICSRELSRARRRRFDISAATEMLRPATELLRPATGLLRPAIGLLRPATELVRPATGLLYRTRRRRWW